MVTSACLINPDNLNLSFKRIAEVDKCEFSKVTTLNLSYNMLESLGGMEQFSRLEQLFLNQNDIQKLDSLHQITDRLSILNLEGGGSLFVTANGATVVLNADGSVSYFGGSITPDLAPGATLVDTFTYTISDGSGGTSTATAKSRSTSCT